MKKRLLLALPAALLAVHATASDRGFDWEIGPNIKGRNHSVGMPSVMDDSRDGPSFEFPTRRSGLVKYVTIGTRPLDDARSVTIRYRVDAPPGTRFIAPERPNAAPMVSLYFQRRGDNWSASGRYATYRWYAARDKTLPLTPGVHQVTLDMDKDWVGVMGARAQGNPGFYDALANAERIGFVFGTDGGRGHGVYATEPARFTLLDFDIR